MKEGSCIWTGSSTNSEGALAPFFILLVPLFKGYQKGEKMERIIRDMGNVLLEYLDEEGEVRLEVLLEEDTEG